MLHSAYRAVINRAGEQPSAVGSDGAIRVSSGQSSTKGPLAGPTRIVVAPRWLLAFWILRNHLVEKLAFHRGRITGVGTKPEFSYRLSCGFFAPQLRDEGA